MRCTKCCEHYCSGFCDKWNERISVSKNPVHYGLLMHPLNHLRLLYEDTREEYNGNLVDIARKGLYNYTAKSICKFYDERGYITDKQRRCLVTMILNCEE